MKFSNLSITICFILILVGCSKNVNDPPLSLGDQERVSAKNVLNNPSPVAFTDVIGQYHGYLQIITANSDNATSLAVVNANLAEIKYAALVKHNIDLELEFGTDKVGMILFGLFEAAKERYIQGGGIIGNYDVYPAPDFFPSPSGPGLDCFLSAVSSFIGLADAKALYKSIIAGASAQTALAALKLIARRVGTVISVAIMIYNVINCLYAIMAEPPPVPPPTSSPVPNPDPGTGTESGFSYIPHSFFHSNREFFDQHKNDIINYLMTEKGMSYFQADQIVEGVYTCGGDPGYLGTGYVEDYFSDAGSFDDGPVLGPTGPGNPVPNP